MGSKWVKMGLSWVKRTKMGLNGLNWERIGSKRVKMEKAEGKGKKFC